MTVASSRPATGGNTNVGRSGVRKVQSSAFVQSHGKETKLQANKLRINQNSGQLHAPKIPSHSGLGGKNSFHLSKDAYAKLTANYNHTKIDGANRK